MKNKGNNRILQRHINDLKDITLELIRSNKGASSNIDAPTSTYTQAYASGKAKRSLSKKQLSALRKGRQKLKLSRKK